MAIFSDYGRKLQVLKFCGEIITSLAWYFTTKNSLFKIDFEQNFFNCQPIFNNFAAHFSTNLAPFSAEKIVCLQLYEKEDIRKIPLSERRHYTLVE